MTGATCITATCATRTAPSPRLTFQARAQAQEPNSIPVSNDASGGVTGFYIDAGNVYHGFLTKKSRPKNHEDREEPRGQSYNRGRVCRYLLGERVACVRRKARRLDKELDPVVARDECCDPAEIMRLVSWF